MDMHTFNDAKHNAARSRLKISLEKVAKKHGIDLGEGSEVAWICLAYLAVCCSLPWGLRVCLMHVDA